jgi:F0F1-type ATP synthase beta subunit
MSTTDQNLPEGRILSVVGPVIDVEFPPDALPEINTPSSSTASSTARARC